MSVLIKNGRIVTATDDYQGDVLIEGETVSAMGKRLTATADTTIDATGLVELSWTDPFSHDSNLPVSGV